MKMYRFNIRNVIKVELSEPTIECFEQTLEQTFAVFFMNKEMLENVKEDFKALLETGTYEIIKDGE